MNSPTLAEVQQSLQQHLLKQASEIALMTVATDKFSHQQRLAIYSDAYQLRLLDALQNDYPALLLQLGDRVFSQLMGEYIAQYPSRQPSLRWLGEKLPQFLRDHPQWQQQVQLQELADFEWAQISVFDAQDSVAVTMADLHALSHSHWPQLQLRFQPALQVLSYYSNAPEQWHNLTNNQSTTLNINEAAQHWLLWRSDLQVLYRPLDNTEAWCIQTFMQGKNFSEVCAGLCNWLAEEQVPLTAVGYLQQWLQDGLVIEIV